MRRIICGAVSAALFCAGPARSTVDVVTRADDAEGFIALARMMEEIDIAALQTELNARHRPEATLISGVTLVDVGIGDARPQTDILIIDGEIAAIAQSSAPAVPADARVIDAAGLFAIPGLTDMHVHGLTSSAQHLLNIAHGVTMVRDMAGYPWLLRERDQAAAGELFAPSMFVTGPILNSFAMSWYAQVVETEAEARAAVAAHAAAGYDAIKVHNRMSDEILAAVFDEAAAQGLDVVGHIPHEASVAEAVALGFRTAEHFKGYIDDSTLQPSEEDWRAASRGAQMWNTPTIYATNAHLYGDEAHAALNAPEASLVSPLDLEDWRAQAEGEVTPILQLRRAARGHMENIFRVLHEDGAPMLAGTDSGGGYPFMVYGRALIDEVMTFERLGMSPIEALRTATSEPAAAMRRAGAFGALRLGARADIVLLREDPLATTQALLSVETVCLRGACLERAAIDDIISDLQEIYATTDLRLEAGEIAGVDLSAALSQARALTEAGFVFRDHQLLAAADALGRQDMAAEAGELRGWMTNPDFTFGPIQ